MDELSARGGRVERPTRQVRILPGGGTRFEGQVLVPGKLYQLPPWFAYQVVKANRGVYVEHAPAERAPSGAGRRIPDDFPGASELADAGISTLAELTAVEDLTDIAGIGQVTAEKIRAALDAAEEG